jgi:hypothetical protein
MWITFICVNSTTGNGSTLHIYLLQSYFVKTNNSFLRVLNIIYDKKYISPRSSNEI